MPHQQHLFRQGWWGTLSGDKGMETNTITTDPAADGEEFRRRIHLYIDPSARYPSSIREAQSQGRVLISTPALSSPSGFTFSETSHILRSPELGYLSTDHTRNLSPLGFHRNTPPSTQTSWLDSRGFTAEMSKASPSDHHRNRPPLFRGHSSSDSSSSASSSGRPARGYPIDDSHQNRPRAYFHPVPESPPPEYQYKLPDISPPPHPGPSSRQQYPNVLNQDTYADEWTSSTRPRPADHSPKHRSAKTNFFTWKNLPSRRLLEKCFAAYFGACGLSRVLCPYPPSEAWEMLRAVFSAAASSGGSGSVNAAASGGSGGGSGGVFESGAAASYAVGYPRGESALHTSANSQLCQALLIAAVGSQNLSGHEMIPAETSEALFASGKWYLDVMFGKDADELQKFRANILCGLCLIFKKSIKAKEHFGFRDGVQPDRAFMIGQVLGLHHQQRQPQQPRPDSRHSPSGWIRGASQSPPNAVPQSPWRSPPHQAYAASSASSSVYNVYSPAYLERAWNGLLFLDGWISASVGFKPATISIPEDYSMSSDGSSYGYQSSYDPAHQVPQSSVYSHHISPVGYNSNSSHPSAASPQSPPPFPNPPAAHGPYAWVDELEEAVPDLHHHLASLGTLMAEITTQVVAPETRAHISIVNSFSERLKAWHANLPEHVTLKMAIRESCDSPTKNTILLLHCAYLGCIILLSRRLHLESVASMVSSGIEGPFYPPPSGDVADFSRMCVSAAKQLATVVDMLRSENRVTRRCWLIIQSAYSAAIVISLDLSSRRGRPMLESEFNECLSLISKCAHVLHFCSTFDSVAHRYMKILIPIHQALSKPALTPAAAATKRALLRGAETMGIERMYGSYTPSNEELLEYIMSLMRRPYGGESTVVESDSGWGVQKNSAPEGYRFAPNLAETPFPGSAIHVAGTVGVAVSGFEKRTAVAATSWHHNGCGRDDGGGTRF